jgi:hypothetical protein
VAWVPLSLPSNWYKQILRLKIMPFKTLASDIGGVLLRSQYAADGGTADHSADAEWLPDALISLQALSSKYTVYLLSFCGKRTEDLTRERLRLANVHSWLPEERWLFCRNRNHKPLLMKAHGIEVLIDDLDTIIENVRAHGLIGIYFTDWEQALRDLAAAETTIE